MKKTLKVIFNIIAWIILILALIVTLLVFSSDRNNGVANLFGYKYLAEQKKKEAENASSDDQNDENNAE